VTSFTAADISKTARQAAQFKERLRDLKSQIGQNEFGWYPHESLDNFLVFDKLLQGRFRTLLNDLEGAPVLDIGCADGDVAFFLESIGFHVEAIDHPSTNFNGMRGIRKLKEALRSTVEIISRDIDSQFELPNRTYDLVFFLGTLYHLRNPYYILDLLARQARFCFISTRVARFTPDHIEIRKSPVAYLLQPDELNNDATNYWIFSETGLKRILRRTGWEICNYVTVGDRRASRPDTPQNDERAFCLVRNRRLTDPGLTAALLTGWHQLEQGHWRWTERCFSAEMAIPEDRSRATLELHFVYPDSLKQHIESIRLKASIGNVLLGETHYSSNGEHVYRATVPSRLLRNSTVTVMFELDQALPPDSVDMRERGVVVSHLGLY
jgi:tRNA (mo5U34)-methyltransferase